MRVRPPEGFEAVYLPTKDFEKVVKGLKKLGLDVDVYMDRDVDSLGRIVLDTCLDTSRSFDLGDVVAELVVSGCVSEKSLDIVVKYRDTKSFESYTAYEESVEFRDAVESVSKVIQSIRNIVEEHMRKTNNIVLKRREFLEKLEQIIMQRGYAKSIANTYKKNVYGYEITITCIDDIQICGVAIGDFNLDKLQRILDEIEKLLKVM